MFKKTMALLLAATMGFSLISCGNTNEAATEKASEEASEETSENKDAASEETASAETGSKEVTLGTVANTLAEDEEALVSAYADKFTQETYNDSETGLAITYNVYLPADYDEKSSYPMVVFIGDSSCTGNDATVSLTQGRGGLVWATEEWQSVHPTIVAVPTYPETILDDHGSYTTTEYVELTKRYIDFMSSEYAVDANRIYGTGQSMGCMTTLILASEYPDLYAACMFVDGQWDVSTLSGLKDQTFVYFAAEDDTNAWNGAQEVMAMFDDDGEPYVYAQWDGTWSVDELSVAAKKLFTADENQYFISWKTGTIDASTGNSMGGGGKMTPPSGEMGEGAPEGMKPPTNESGDETQGGMTPSSGDPSAEGAPSDSGMNSSAYHMASFDYAYNCVAVMEWLFGQSK
ncbi:MAG: prolyl oligopeptidase family serine peptidase [Lachnospiraceae bacterium]|nr:prolyl oligopeptidase family serine peptidase [Lachnospiraceae bacterium]